MPYIPGKAVQIVAVYVLLDQPEYHAGIEIVSCAYGAHRDNRPGTEEELLSVVYHMHAVLTPRADKSGAVTGCFLIYSCAVVMSEQVGEILMTAANDVGKSEILTESIPKALYFMGMVVTEIQVIIEDCAILPGVFKERVNLVPKDRVK